MTPNEFPVTVLDTDDGVVVFHRGHCDLDAFDARVREAFGATVTTWQGPWHSYWRQMPGGVEYMGRFETAEKKQKGAFRVTWMREFRQVLQ